MTREPGETPGAEFELVGGSDDMFEGYFSVEGGSDRVRGRLSASADTRDGWRKNRTLNKDVEGQESYGVRGTLVTDVSDQFSLVWRADWRKEEIKDGPAWGMFFIDTDPNSLDVSPLAPGGIFQPILNLPPRPSSEITDNGEDFYTNFAEGLERSTGGASVTATWQPSGGSWDVKSILAWRDADLDRTQDVDGNALDMIHETMSEGATQYSWELDVGGTTSGGTEWIAGIYLFDEEADFKYHYDFDALALAIQTLTAIELNVPIGSLAGAVQPNYDIDSTIDTFSSAVFGQVTVPLTDRLSVTGGARYTVDDKELVQNIGLLGAVSCANTKSDDDWDSFTWKAGVDYRFTDDVLWYGNITTGFKSGGLNPVTCGDTYEPEEITSYETGVKTTLLDGRMRLNGSVYYYDYTDLQSIILSEASTIENASDAEIFGADVEFVWLPTDRLEVVANVNVLDSEFQDFLAIDTLNPNLGPQDLSGNELPRAPGWSGNLAPTYTQPLSVGALDFRYELYYSDDYYHDIFNSEASHQESFTIQNVRVSWRNDLADGHRWEVGAFVENFGDEQYKNITVALTPAGGYSAQYADPRVWGVFVRRVLM